MHGIGPPLVTPFDRDGEIDEPALRELVDWMETRGVDLLVPCGSNSEAELMTAEERARVVEVVADAAEVPVLAGTGHPGLKETTRQTERAADAGADAALVVTPFYFDHDQDALAAYYRELADAVPLPVYLYSVPAYTGVRLAPETVGELASHGGIHGMKDSSGDLEAFQRAIDHARDAEFDMLVGSGGVLAGALDAGGAGGVLALANVAPERATEVYERHRAGDREAARVTNRDLVELNHAVTKRHGIAGLKAAMRMRGAPAGRVRSPHRPVDAATESELRELVRAAEP